MPLAPADYRENLAWGTTSENQMDGAMHGTTRRGERYGVSKLTMRQVVEIRRLSAEGVPIHEIAEKLELI